jgi:hypothetical protein
MSPASINKAIVTAVGTPCARCGRIMHRSRSTTGTPSTGGETVVTHVSRGLCSACYPAVIRDDTLEQYPRLQRDRDQLLDRYAAMRAAMPNASLLTIAQHMGVPRSTLSQTLKRAAADGDERSDHKQRNA